MIKLSVLICAIPSRWKSFQKIFTKLEKQATDEVEILGFIDNKKRTIGAKRDAMRVMAKGEYLCYVDDDDDVSDDFIEEILKGIEESPDVIVFKQKVIIDGIHGLVDFDISYNNEEFKPNQITRRKPFHICIWKTEIAKKYEFPDNSYGEDFGWVEKMHHEISTQHRINKVLHTYIFDSNITEAI